MTNETLPPALAGQVERGVRPHAEMLARRLQATAYNHGYEDAHPANATTRQAKTDAVSRQTLADLLIAIVALGNENEMLRANIDSSPSVDEWREKDAEIALLQAEYAKSERRAIVFGDIVHSQVLAMQAAVIEGHLKTPAHGLQWIVNTLTGPGHLPDLEEARELGGAQAWWGRETAKHEEFRAAHPGPVALGPNVEITGG